VEDGDVGDLDNCYMVENSDHTEGLEEVIYEVDGRPELPPVCS